MLNQNTRFMQTTCTMILSAIDRLLTALFPVRRGRAECGMWNCLFDDTLA